MSFRLGRIRVELSFYFFALLAAFFCFEPDGAAGCGALAALLHESGHLAVMLLTPGCRIRRVHVGSCGVRIDTVCCPDSGWGMICVAGAACNILCAAISALLTGVLGSRFLSLLASSNLFLGVLNLLPVEPLDGGQLLRTLLLRRARAERVDTLCLICSLCALLPMLTVGLLVLMRTRYNFSLLLLGLWLLGGVVRDYV